ncbi:Rieske (2Fe-2S) protein [Thermodesulfobacterium sp. TA1]|uniref:QcrA and Rieske domain-containing protein n=1 Tax=Thermodesulfobacterium sp. TA1 TaxID=2234087 RepID=UPI001231F6D1|nr:Rieske (2Fe-2S) protein [Thermodesulfobacterium sp. TA1]QER41398.1 Rieske (2Fe-2S) protein [Thermodesulfobacterium sp. TA1]
MKTNRRSVLRLFSLGVLGFLTYGVFKNLTTLSSPPPKKVWISFEEIEKAKGILFKDSFIILKTEGEVRVFSRRCPHLGCLLNYSSEESLIVCPCHQSKFNLKGKFLSGPAKKDLQTYNFRLNSKGLEVEVI